MVVGFKNYLHNQCISPLKLWVWLPLIARCTQYNSMCPAQVCGFFWVLRFPPPIKLTPLYNWTISLCGVQQHDPNLNPTIISISALSYVHSISRNGEVWAHINLFNSTAFYLSSCTKSVKWVVIQLCVGVSMLPRSTIWCLILRLFRQCDICFISFYSPYISDKTIVLSSLLRFTASNSPFGVLYLSSFIIVKQ